MNKFKTYHWETFFDSQWCSTELFHIRNITFSYYSNIPSTDAYAHILDLLYVKLSFRIEEKRRKNYVIGRIVVESHSLLGQEPNC